MEFAGAGKILAERLLDLFVTVSNVWKHLAENTYDNTSNAVLGVAALLQVLRDNSENGGGESHVEEAMRFGATGLELLKVLLKLVEGLILVVLARDVSANLGELLKLVFNFFGRSLDVGLDAAEILLVVHLRAGVTDNSAVLGEELVAVLRFVSVCGSQSSPWMASYSQGRREQGTKKTWND